MRPQTLTLPGQLIAAEEHDEKTQLDAPAQLKRQVAPEVHEVKQLLASRQSTSQLLPRQVTVTLEVPRTSKSQVAPSLQVAEKFEPSSCVMSHVVVWPAQFGAQVSCVHSTS